MEEALARFGHKENTLSFTTLKIQSPDGCGVAVAKVDPPAFILRDLRGKSHTDPAFLDAVFHGSDAAYVCGVGKNTPRVALEAIPLGEEVVAAMVAYFADQSAVNFGYLVKVWREDDEFPAIRHHGLELIHALPGDP